MKIVLLLLFIFPLSISIYGLVNGAKGSGQFWNFVITILCLVGITLFVIAISIGLANT